MSSEEVFDKLWHDEQIEKWSLGLSGQLSGELVMGDESEAWCVRVIGYCLGLAGRHKDEQGVRRCR